MSAFDLSVLFFLQLGVILAACRAVSALVKFLGQPPVVGEMVAGVLLGPSLLGLLWPGLMGLLPDGMRFELFPKESMPIIFAVAQVGIAVYMFVVGVEFRADLIRPRIRSAAAVSITGMIVPFVLGGFIAIYLVGWQGALPVGKQMFSAAATPAQACLYLGAAMSITAFPMLARIIQDKGLSGTPLGALALAAGSIDDAAAWCVLAIVLGSFGDGPSVAIMAIGGGAAYVLLVLTLGRRLLKLLGRRVEAAGSMSTGMLASVLAIVMLASWFTDRIGIYAVFGAFILGAAMPRGCFAAELRRHLQPMTTSLLVPLFFVYSGLNTRLTLIDTPSLWVLAVGILLAACIGKGVACWAAARLSGEPPRHSLAIGALMNTRGMMGLVILNIGLERGIITPTLFSIMMVMTIATTMMGTPLFDWFYGRRRDGCLARGAPAGTSTSG